MQLESFNPSKEFKITKKNSQMENIKCDLSF